MFRIFITIVIATACLMACAKKPTTTMVFSSTPERTDTILISTARLPATFPDYKLKPRPVREPRAVPPITVTFAKGSFTLSKADTERLGKLRLRKAITVTGYASNERGKRPGGIEAARNYRLSMKRAQAVCAAVSVDCTPVAGGETGSISSVLDGNRIAGFVR